MLKLAVTVLVAICLFHTSSSQSCSSIDQETLILETFNGKIRGQCVNAPVKYADKYQTSADVLIWQSVPYAEPPVGVNRFRAPVPAGQWDNLILDGDNILDGTKPPNSCLQLNRNDTSEDCLYLNIYVEKNTYLNRKNELKPILVWIHGGGFVLGSGSDYDGRTIVSMSDVIVVTINYRLDALGFLHVAGTYVTGNQGLLDTSLALKWIAENAKFFGGDNKKITISGESAGGWNVGFQLFMPQSWPFFRNAIMQSGGITGINNFAQLLTSKDATDRANVFFHFLDCLKKDNKLSVECAEQKSEAELLDAYVKASDFYRSKEKASWIGLTGSLPVIDNIVFKKSIPHLTADNAFKRCNILTGHNSDEYALFLLYIENVLGEVFIENGLENAQNFNLFKFYEFLKNTFKYFPIYPFESPFLIGKIFYEYFTPQEIQNSDSVNLLARYSQIVSDFSFNCQAYQIASLYSRTGNSAFMYEFSYRLNSSAIPDYLSQYFGTATHADEIPVIFGQPLEDKFYNSFSQAERDFTQKIIFYWTNFAKYDNPSGVTFDSVTTWLPFAEPSWGYQNEYYQTGRSLSINNDRIFMKSGFTSHHCKFWGF